MGSFLFLFPYFSQFQFIHLIFSFKKLFQIFFHWPGHFFWKIRIIFTAAKSCSPVLKAFLSAAAFKHISKFFSVHTAVCIFMYNVLLFKPYWFWSVFLLLCWPSKHQHHSRKNIFRKLQKSALFLTVFHNITYIAGTNTKAFRRHNCILRCNRRICYCQHKIPGSRFSGCTPGFQICVIPFFTVRTKYQNHWRFCNKRLIITGLW